MSFTHSLTQAANGMSQPISRSNNYTAGSEVNVDEAVPDSTTDQLVTIAIDVSAIQSFYMVSDQVLTVEFNNSTTGVPTIVLAANIPFIETADNYHVDLLGTDITVLYLTNASGSIANFKLRCVFDPTP